MPISTTYVAGMLNVGNSENNVTSCRGRGRRDMLLVVEFSNKPLFLKGLIFQREQGAAP